MYPFYTDTACIYTEIALSHMAATECNRMLDFIIADIEGRRASWCDLEDLVSWVWRVGRRLRESKQSWNFQGKHHFSFKKKIDHEPILKILSLFSMFFSLAFRDIFFIPSHSVPKPEEEKPLRREKLRGNAYHFML